MLNGFGKQKSAKKPSELSVADNKTGIKKVKKYI